MFFGIPLSSRVPPLRNNNESQPEPCIHQIFPERDYLLAWDYVTNSTKARSANTSRQVPARRNTSLDPLAPACLNITRSSLLQGDNLFSGDPQGLEPSPWSLGVAKAGDHNTVVLQARQRRRIKNSVVQEASSSLLFIYHTHEFQVHLQHTKIGHFGGFAHAVKNDSLLTLVCQRAEPGPKDRAGLSIKLERVLHVFVSEPGFFRDPLGGDQIANAILLDVDDLDVPLLGQALEVQIYESEGDPQPLGKAPLGHDIARFDLI